MALCAGRADRPVPDRSEPARRPAELLGLALSDVPPTGLVDAFTGDLADVVQYAHEHKDDKPATGAVYGGIEGGMTSEADEFIRSVMADMLDKHQGLPRET